MKISLLLSLLLLSSLTNSKTIKKHEDVEESHVEESHEEEIEHVIEEDKHFEKGIKKPILPPIVINPKCCKDCGTIDANGFARTFLTADQAVLYVTFCTKAATTELAQTNNNIKVNSYIKAVKGLSNSLVISTENIQFFEDVKVNPDGTTTIIGWQACITVVVRFPDLKFLSKAIDLASVNKASSLFTDYTVSDEQNDKNQYKLFVASADNAKSKAEIIAKRYGCTIACVKSVTIDDYLLPSAGVSKTLSARAADTSTPVLPGRIEISKFIRVSFFIRCKEN